METSFVCTVQRIRQGSLIIECKHESREDGLAMMKNHVKVKDAILECLHEIDPHVNVIKVEVEYREESHVESGKYFIALNKYQFSSGFRS